MYSMKRAGLAILVMAAAACAPAAPATPAVDVAAEDAAVRAVSARWMALEGERDAAGIAGLFAADGRLVWSGQDPVVGPAAIEAFLVAEYAKNPKQTSSWAADHIQISAAGDLAIEFGHYENAMSGADGAGSGRGNYVTVYEKTDGMWKVKADASVTSIPTAAPGM